jgi:flavorubredoxin
VLSSYGWSGGIVKAVQGILEETKIEMLGVVEVKGPPKKAEFDRYSNWRTE